ncbi:MAG: serine/threonine-protein kinase [Myxococcota bacterium]|nr:serine/threonine-protein kinase [Myxococcota bacterium]
MTIFSTFPTLTRNASWANNLHVSSSDQKLPARFGPFFLYDQIGVGGMAEIFLAKRFTGLGSERQIAIKRILPTFVTDDNFGEMIIAEAKLCSQLSHANVVQTYDLGRIENLYYIAMEYVEGFDLNRLLGLLARSKKALPLQFALYIIIETLRGLDYAHRVKRENGEPLGIIHRDVSPTNVLISTEGEVKLCDFGIAKVAYSNASAEHIDAYHLKGKIAYMAPEHLNNEEVDCRADLYAAGILMWELLSGRRLFKSKDEEETLRRTKAADVSPLENRGFPDFEMLGAIVTRALTKDPDKRFQTGLEFIRSIEDYMHLAGLMVSQLKFSDFLMTHFGESLLEQRRERERSLAELGDYQKQSERDASIDTTPEVKTTHAQAEAIRATFSNQTDLYDDEVLPKAKATATQNQVNPEDDILADAMSAEAMVVTFSKLSDLDDDDEDHPEDIIENELAGDDDGGYADDTDPSLSIDISVVEPKARKKKKSASVWQPDLSKNKVMRSAAWIAGGMAVVVAAAATLTYLYMNGII